MLALALPLGGCVAGMVAGAAAGAISGAARGSGEAGAPPADAAVYHGFGRNPGWVLDVFQGSVVFVVYGETPINVPAPPVTTTFDGHRYETPELTVEIRHATCGFTSGGATYPTSVTVNAGGREFIGCGQEVAAH